MRFVVVTGMSGAGKSTALKMLEDMVYFELCPITKTGDRGYDYERVMQKN